MSSDSNQSCHNCCFWELTNDEDDSGECRRYAPRPKFVMSWPKEEDDMEPDNLFVHWPETFSGEWCGEWKENN